MIEIELHEIRDFKLPDMCDLLGVDQHRFAEPHWWEPMELLFERELCHVVGFGKIDVMDDEIQ